MTAYQSALLRPNQVLHRKARGERNIESTVRRQVGRQLAVGLHVAAVATAFALPGTVASGETQRAGIRTLAILHPQGRIEVEVSVEGEGQEARLQRAALIRSARKIMQGQLTLPHYLFSEA